MAQHTVQTTHIQRLIRNGLNLAERAHGKQKGGRVAAGETRLDPAADAAGLSHLYEGTVPVEHALQKAAADLRHAAEELEAERLSVLGWKQV